MTFHEEPRLTWRQRLRWWISRIPIIGCFFPMYVVPKLKFIAFPIINAPMPPLLFTEVADVQPMKERLGQVFFEVDYNNDNRGRHHGK